ncbi:hypothetical protein SAMN05216390_11698 [Lachnospiraceae bacterium KH1T2]|nr:hypothetical protein SAMN05216390_11698 [Lachnospiraceae bacterium KH1T2]
MRIWCKEWHKGKVLRDCVIEDYENDTRTHKIIRGLEKACHELDLAVPIWLDSNVGEFKRSSKTRFRADSFIEEIPFDYLELQIIEEDY